MLKTDVFLFVSHVREDQAAAMEIVAELERRGVLCWVAPRDVRPGKPFDEEIAEALENCQAMLLIFSDRCNENDYIRREVTVAGEIGRVIIPFRIEDVPPRKALRVRLSDLHWIDGFISRERAIDEVARIFAPIARAEAGLEPTGPAVAAGGIAEQPPRKRAELPRPNHRKLLIVGALAGALLGLAVLLIVFYGIPEGPSITRESSVSPSDLIRRGNAYLEKQDYDRAIADYTEAIRLDPKDGAAFHSRGVAYFDNKDYDRAIADFTDAIRLDPKDAVAFRSRGRVYFEKGDKDRAIADFTDAIRLDPKDAVTWNGRGRLYSEKGDYDRAIVDYTEAIRLDPKNAMALYWRGDAKGRKGDHTGAEADVAAASAIDPNVGK